MNFKKFISAALAVAMLGAMSVSAFAVNTYAYSIGGKNEDGHDFTPNVKYSNTIFGMMQSITSAYMNYTPNNSYLNGNNPGGDKRIGSKLVLLTGHASPNVLYLDHGTTLIGINRTRSFTATSGRVYTGLDNINMNNADLIMLLGCSTAAGTNNLASKSISQGAKSALGTTDSVVSRTGDGAVWVQSFLDGLYYGKTINKAALYANTFVPSSNSMRMYWTIKGDADTVVNPANKTVSSTIDNVLSKTINDSMVEENSTITRTISNIPKLNPSIVQDNINLDFTIFENNMKFIDANIYSNELENVVNFLNNIDQSFDLSNYKIFMKSFNDNNTSGIVSLCYFIGEDISTDKTFDFIYEDGKLSNICYNKDFFDVAKNANNYSNSTLSPSDEEELIKIVNNHQLANPQILSPSDNTKLHSKYAYNYKNQELAYIKECFSFNGEVWVDEYNKDILN
ncbi:MAG: hypothetical protein RSC41_04885 [Oscillospiraceae bacterium]